MKRGLIIGLVTVTGIIGLSLLVFSNPKTEQQSTESIRSLQPKTVIYDVRTAEEYAESRVESAQLLPLGDIQAGSLPNLPKDTPIALYCRSGNRSAQATSILSKAGFSNITDMGGISNVSNFGLAVSSPTKCSSNC